MKEIIQVPTGKIIVDDYSKGKLETLTIGDYGKDKNIKADFLGFHREIHGVPNGKCVRLSEKWVITLSTQYGCAMSCKFCDCPSIKFKGNASVEDLKTQLLNAIAENPDVKYTDRLNIHFARMGEPVFNSVNIFDFSRFLADKRDFQRTTGLAVETIHPVFTTMCPKSPGNALTIDAVNHWVHIKNNAFNGQAGLQLSINTTSQQKRDEMFNGKAMSLVDIAEMGNNLPDPLGRKYCLNFAILKDTEIDPHLLASLFDPRKFMVKLTPIHNNNACTENGYSSIEGYSSFDIYRDHELKLKQAGFDVLVFVPSMDEENSTITCGNAILGGSKIKY